MKANRLICIVDDDAAVRDSLRVMLEARGHQVFAYDSGSAFLAGGRHHSAGCLVVDRHMFGADGLSTVAALRERGCTLPVILMTGRIDKVAAERAASLNVAVILEKPFVANRLLEFIESNLAAERPAGTPTD